MEREFVPYVLAVKLKELGFDEPCFNFYMGGFKELGKIKLVLPNNIHDSNVLAPTFSQAFRWFREKYNIHSSPKKYDETKWWVEWGTWTSPVFETFEEAELSWLNKLIEIVESKSE